VELQLSEREIGQFREMVAKDAIRDVLHLYCRAMDRCDLELLESVFHEDAREDHGGLHEGSAREFCALAIDYVRRMAMVAHYVANALIRVVGDVALVESYGIALHRIPDDQEGFDSVFGARLLDRFEHRDGAWRIAHRRVVYDWNRDTAVAQTWGRGFFSGEPQGGAMDRSDPSYAFFARPVSG
jgi:hypothetical protein